MSSAPRGAEAGAAKASATRVSLTVLMPGLNEEANVERAVSRCVAALDQVADEFEVLVIDDGSTDRTGEIARALSVKDPRIRVLRNEVNVNYGVSLLRGFAAAHPAGVVATTVPEPEGLCLSALGALSVVAKKARRCRRGVARVRCVRAK